MQDGGVGWRHDGVDDRPGKVDGPVSALEIDRWKMAAATSESASVRYGTQSLCVAWLGHPALDVRVWCDVHLVLGPEIWHIFINETIVATSVT